MCCVFLRRLFFADSDTKFPQNFILKLFGFQSIGMHYRSSAFRTNDSILFSFCKQFPTELIPHFTSAAMLYATKPYMRQYKANQRCYGQMLSIRLNVTFCLIPWCNRLSYSSEVKLHYIHCYDIASDKIKHVAFFQSNEVMNNDQNVTML